VSGLVRCLMSKFYFDQRELSNIAINWYKEQTMCKHGAATPMACGECSIDLVDVMIGREM